MNSSITSLRTRSKLNSHVQVWWQSSEKEEKREKKMNILSAITFNGGSRISQGGNNSRRGAQTCYFPKKKKNCRKLDPKRKGAEIPWIRHWFETCWQFQNRSACSIGTFYNWKYFLPVVNYPVFGFLSQRIDHLSRLICCHGLRTVVLNEIRNNRYSSQQKIKDNSKLS